MVESKFFLNFVFTNPKSLSCRTKNGCLNKPKMVVPTNKKVNRKKGKK